MAHPTRRLVEADLYPLSFGDVTNVVCENIWVKVHLSLPGTSAEQQTSFVQYWFCATCPQIPLTTSNSWRIVAAVYQFINMLDWRRKIANKAHNNGKRRRIAMLWFNELRSRFGLRCSCSPSDTYKMYFEHWRRRASSTDSALQVLFLQLLWLWCFSRNSNCFPSYFARLLSVTLFLAVSSSFWITCHRVVSPTFAKYLIHLCWSGVGARSAVVAFRLMALNIVAASAFAALLISFSISSVSSRWSWLSRTWQFSVELVVNSALLWQC